MTNKNVGLWRLVTIIASVLLVIMIVGNVLISLFEGTIDLFLSTSHSQTIGDGESEIFFESEFGKKDANGKPVLSTDKSNKGKQVIDGNALSAAGDALCQEVAKEGFVLISNKNNALPLAAGTKVSLFGQSVDNPVTSGTGSGATGGNGATYVSALKDSGLVLNEESYKFYSEGAGRSYRLQVPGMHDNNPFKINECPWATVQAASNYNTIIDCDTAIVAFSRNGGEGYDLANGVSTVGYDTVGQPGTIVCSDSYKGNGNYLELNEDERGILAGLKALKDQSKIKKIVVVLNAANAIQLDFLNKDICGVDYGVDACIWTGATGQSGLNALGGLLSGKDTFSGQLVDTYCYDNLLEPSIYNFGHNAYSNYDDVYRTQGAAGGKGMWMNEKYYNVYREGIYVGYRYHETRYADYVMGTTNDTTSDYAKAVAYSFGHGLSYADFEYTKFEVEEKGTSLVATVTVKNNSETYSGKEVVELYAQTPYGAYEKANGVEKSAIELVGFEKTALLAPGAEETVTIEVAKEVLAGYDANTAKTYVMTAGDYYLSIGNGAHDALNNILAITPGADASKMVADPDPIAASCDKAIKAFTVASDDTTTYAKSSVTGKDITNQFENADLNKYVAEGTVTYVSRNDWKGTFDTTSKESMKATHVDLALNDKMYADIKYDKLDIPEDLKNATMPKMGVENKDKLKLIMFKGVPLDGSITYNGKEYTWDDLLNQVTFKEMAELISKGQHATAKVSSVAKPATRDENGPSGFSGTFLGGGSGTSYPAPCLRAATWNKDLLKRVGELIGEDGLAANFNGLYGPAANTHRNAFGGRNFEYYSEDPCLASYVGESETVGIQSKGIIVYMKHFFLNESESHREGVGTWCNEQAIREVYLAAFEGAMRGDRGNAHAIMSSFSRLGTIWNGDHYGLMNNVIRNEWAFDGFIVTDADVCDGDTHCTGYMYAPRAVLNGTDIFDGVGNQTDHNRVDELTAQKSNAAVVTAMRNSTKRILFQVVNSAAMNGMSTQSEVIRVLPAWHVAVIVLTVVSAVAAVAGAALWVLNGMNILSFPKKGE